MDDCDTSTRPGFASATGITNVDTSVGVVCNGNNVDTYGDAKDGPGSIAQLFASILVLQTAPGTSGFACVPVIIVDCIYDMNGTPSVKVMLLYPAKSTGIVVGDGIP
jgi:hypothetical protein